MIPLIIALLAASQVETSLDQNTAVIEGVVYKQGSSEPLAGTRVALVKEGGPAGTPNVTTTLSDGTFRFTDLPSGSYRIVANRNDGYLPAEYGQPKPLVRGTPVDVTSGQTLRGLQLSMSSSATITGRVLDRDGDPVGRAQVVALKSTYDRDGHRIQTIAQAIQTNDLGEYRMFWIPPGQYYIMAKPVDIN